MAEGTYHNLGEVAQYTDLSTVVTLSDVPASGAVAPERAYRCLIQAEGQNVRWTDDGVNDPTATYGMILYAEDGPYPYEGRLDKLRFIEVLAGAKLNVTYYGGT